MYNFIDVDHPAIGIIYSLIMIVIGNFFLMNLILAVIMDTYVIYQERDIKKKMKHEKANSIEVAEEELVIPIIADLEKSNLLEWVKERELSSLALQEDEDEEEGDKKTEESAHESEIKDADSDLSSENLNDHENEDGTLKNHAHTTKANPLTDEKMGKAFNRILTEKAKHTKEKPSSSMSLNSNKAEGHKAVH